MPISSNRRQRVIEFATPKVADLVVVERVDASKNVNSAATADDAADVNGNFGAAHPDTTRFPNFKLALIKNSDNEQGQYQDWYYVKDRANQDEYNWEFQAAGASSPRFDTVVRTYVTLRSAFKTGTDEADADDIPKIGNANGMPTVSADPFTNTGSNYDNNYVLFEKKQTRSGDEVLDSLYVVEQHIFVKRVTIRSIEADKEFPYNDYNTDSKPYGGLVSKETLFHKDEDVKATTSFLDTTPGTEGVQQNLHQVGPSGSGDNAAKRQAEYVFSDKNAYYDISSVKYPFWGIDEFGIMREGKQLSDNWYVLFEREIIQKDGNGLVADYYTTQNMGWPAVFETLYTQSWPRRDGSSQLIAYPVFKRESYEGPTTMRIQQYWRKEPFVAPDDVTGSATKLVQVKPMEPMAMFFTTPMFNIQVKKSLHNAYDLLYTTGTEDSEWEYVSYKGSWKATNYDDWPDEIVISDDQKPYRGGYLRTKVTAFNPETGRTDFDDDDGEPPTE